MSKSPLAATLRKALQVPEFDKEGVKSKIMEQATSIVPAMSLGRRSQVVSRKVTRYFLYGKGFAHKIDAYRMMARRELERKIWNMAHERAPKLRLPWASIMQIQRDLERQVLAEMFPPKCERPNESNLPNLAHGARPDFCRGCRWRYLNVRAMELMGEKEEKEKR